MDVMSPLLLLTGGTVGPDHCRVARLGQPAAVGTPPGRAWAGSYDHLAGKKKPVAGTGFFSERA
jgi:hypothetical protein